MKYIQEIAQQKINNTLIGWIVFSFFMIYYTTQGYFAIGIKYPLMNSYIDYNFGFIKRGLFAEIIHFFPFSHTVKLRLMTYLGSFILISFFITQYKNFFTKKEYIIPLLSILFAPFFIKNYMFAVGLSDILFFVFFLGIMTLHHRIAFVMFILYPIMIFIHEAISLFFLPWIMFIFYYRFKDNKITLYTTNIIMLMGFFIASLCILLYGHADISLQELKKYIGSKDNSLDSEYLQALKFFYNNNLEHIKYAWINLFYNESTHKNAYLYTINVVLNLLNWYFVYFLAKPICIACAKTIKEFLLENKINLNKINLNVCFGFIIISTVPLFIMAVDWLRFVANFIGLMVLTSIFCNKKNLIHTYMRYINNFSNQKYIIFMLTTFMFVAIGTYEHIFRLFLSK
jgi:hypothetical protein